MEPATPALSGNAVGLFSALLAGADPGTGGEGVLIAVAHPDDETIGIGGQLARLPRAHMLHLTDGAPRDLRDARAHGFASAEAYAERRRTELLAALSIAGFPARQLTALGIPDQEACRHLPELASRLCEVFTRRRIRLVLTHAYEGGHPDHDATAFAVAAACRMMSRAGEVAPPVLDMPFYRLGPAGPLYQSFPDNAPGPALELRLSGEEWERKRRMLEAHATQRETLGAFFTPIERFRAAPDHDFTRLPNGGQLLYEVWGLGLLGADWQVLAAAALRELGLS